MISFANINKQYGKQLLFVDASFQLNPGEKVGLVGPNGAGKTTLFRMVVGEETPDEGAVSVPKKFVDLPRTVVGFAVTAASAVQGCHVFRCAKFLVPYFLPTAIAATWPWSARNH